MCGISGILNLNKQPVSFNEIIEMTNTITHRGPDNDGYFHDNFIAIGHRRLSIIDLSEKGNQPMISENKRFVISYNGEVYNFNVLRKILEDKGYCFNSKTDSEVVLNAWVEWGQDSVKKFNGMFAFVIWDKKEEELFLVRDRYGIKPLYYSIINNIILFGSEQRVILQYSKFSKKLDKEALYEYFTFQNILTNKTFLENVYLLDSATIAKIDLKKKVLQLNKYWDYNFNQLDNFLNYKESTEELKRLLQQSIKRQLVSDVEVGSYLSGGIDSSLIVAIASKFNSNLKTFTCGFDLNSASGIEFNFDERKKAKSISNLFKTDHFEITLNSGDMEKSIPYVSNYIEECRLGQSYPNFYAAKLAGKNVKVVLSGTGGDELFCGYPWRYFTTLKSNNFDDYIDSYYHYWQRLIDNSQLKKIFSPISNDVKNVWTRDIFKNVFNSCDLKFEKQEDLINYSLYFEAKTFLRSLLIIEDKLSMSQSLETRLPFLDNDLVDFAMKCPVKYKLNNIISKLNIDENTKENKTENYFIKTNEGKKILRNLSGSFIPSEISKAIKQGFSGPDNSWFKGQSMQYVKKILGNKNSIIYNYLDFQSVNEIVNHHFEGKSNKRLFIWSLLCVEKYFSKIL